MDRLETALEVEWLGRIPYGEAVSLQERAVALRRAGRSGDRLLLLEHPPVVTFGRSSKPENLRVAPAELRRRGVELFEARRGGDVTYHAPGQLVGYAICDLDTPGRRDVHRFLRGVECALARALETFELPCTFVPGRTGVFVAVAGSPPRKIASIGIGLRGWVTWHGFALNVSLDLSGFDAIVPCGLRDVEMTSVARELGPAAGGGLDDRVREAVTRSFATPSALSS